MSPANVILFEGILVFYFKEILDMFDLKLFVDMDADMRLAWRGTILCLISVFVMENSIAANPPPDRLKFAIATENH